MPFQPHCDHALISSISQLHAAYAYCLDSDELECWPNFFSDDAVYRILASENERLSLPMPLLILKGRKMLSDRILALRKANLYNIHTDHHVIGCPRVEVNNGSFVRAWTQFSVHQVDQEGIPNIFSLGVYRDVININDGSLVIESRDVILTTNTILNLLSCPL